jgi:hypothetical protein
LHSDNAKEYTSHSFASYLSDKGIIHQTSCAHTPQQNSVTKRKNRHLLDVACCLLIHMHVPKQLWSDVVLTACYLINRMSSSVLDGTSPHSLIYPSSSPFSSPLKVFGCICYVHNLGSGFDKLDHRTTKCVFLGIPQHKRDTVAIVRFFDATSLVPMSHLLSLSPIFLLLPLWVTLPLSLMSSLFRCLFLFSLRRTLLLLQSCCLTASLLHSKFINTGFNHQLMHHHHHPYRL